MSDHRYGPNTADITKVLYLQIPEVDADRYTTISMASLLSDTSTTSQDRALEAARRAGREEQVVTASEDLRRGVWGVIWDSSWADAWRLSWLAARVGLGLATQDLVGEGEYTAADYVNLVGPWMAGFKDMPLAGADAPLSA